MVGALIAARPDTFAMARYVGRFGWIEVQLPNVDEAELGAGRCGPATVLGWEILARANCG